MNTTALRQVFNANKARMGGAGGFLSVLAVPIGIEPDTVPAGIVLLQTIFAMFGMAEPVDPALLEAAFNVLWVAIGAGVFGFVSVWAIPNKLKSGTPAGGAASDGSSSALSSLAAFALATGIVAVLLSGCAAGGKPLEELAPDSIEDKSPAQAVADRLFTEAIGPDHRGVRLCMIASGVVEVMTDRVTHGDAAYAEAAAGQITRIKAVLDNLDTSAANIWFETDVKIVTLELAGVIVDATKSRVAGLLGNFAGGVNVPGVLDRAGIAARQAVLADGIVRDVKRVVAEIGAEKLDLEVATAGCEERIEKNRKRIGAILGEAL
ncbi:hypothetical protein [Dongia deserti]|uniref:hypothetical protein n=1 Tax=Dongia deserti TaxID=2268030 RepID=UPI000E65A54F|nr:hypothetical protein [Dongia deserti]